MAWTSMHFAVGMCSAGVLGGAACIVMHRGYRWLPLMMTAGGVWGVLPDLPRFFREDFPNLPFAATLGSKDLERWLHGIGDVFFFHGRLDAQPREFALHGLFIIIALYAASCVMLIVLESRARRRFSPAQPAKPPPPESPRPAVPGHINLDVEHAPVNTP